MTDKVANELLREHVKSLQGRVSELRAGQQRVERHLWTIEDFVSVLVRASQGANVDLDDIRRRIDRIERRLELQPSD